ALSGGCRPCCQRGRSHRACRAVGERQAARQAHHGAGMRRRRHQAPGTRMGRETVREGESARNLGRVARAFEEAEAMSAMLAVLISILAGISAGAGVMAFLIRRFPRQAEPRLVDPRLFRTVFEAGDDEICNSLDRRMRWAGIPFGAVPLAIISA